MSFNINPPPEAGPEPVAGAAAKAAVTDPATAGEAVKANTTKKSFSLDSKVDSLRELKDKAPEVYDKMMMGIAQSICRKMREQQARLKKMMRESNR